jgi:5-methylthioadenosine/S-adenosylhomocysteine deaminase
MSTAGASAVHSPVPNALLASGIAPVAKMRKAGVNVALGTNTRMDILSAMKFATGLAKLNSMNPLTLTARDVFQMATLNGAKAYGMDQETGSLKAGKKADITIMNLKRSYATPYVDPIMAMVYYLNGGDVDTVIVDGKIVMEEGVIKTVDEGRVIEMVQERAADLTSRMNQMRK